MSEAGRRRRIFSIPPGADFLGAFADALMGGEIIPGFPDAADPFSLSTARIYVPTRRAARALAHELATRVAVPAVLLPEILPLGAMEDSETAALFDVEGAPASPDAVTEIERRLVLTNLILKWGQSLRNAIQHVDRGQIVTNADETFLVTAAPAQAFALAGELGKLIDELTIEGVDPRRLDTLASDKYDKYWEITLIFLKIAFERWPQYLIEADRTDRAPHQAQLIEQEIARLQSGGRRGPQIVVGSTGTNASTARLIGAISTLPQGAVVLPGLDVGLDEAAWQAIGGGDGDGVESAPASGHPQAALRRLLAVLQWPREDVSEIGALDPALSRRLELVREALRPAETTDTWLSWRAALDEQFLPLALRHVACFDADDERVEALAIAIALREALETPGRTAALVTPDRDLALRVRSELGRWGIDVDDSGGDPLFGSAAGVLAMLALSCGEAAAGSSETLALLDHGYVRLGLKGAELARLRPVAEIGALRGVRWRHDDSAGALAAARDLAQDTHAHRLKKRVTQAEWEALDPLFASLAKALEPLRLLDGERALSRWIDAHAQVYGALTRRHDSEAAIVSDDEHALLTLFESFRVAEAEDLSLSFDGYRALMAQMLAQTPVRGPRHSHQRIKILGLLEARLMRADLVILGGLDEGVWPPASRADAFLNRPMRAQLGLTSPERRIGQTAHDFVLAMGAPHVLLTRAKKRGGSPTVASRFIQRIAALSGGAWTDCAARGEIYVDYAKAIDDAGGDGRPAPRPAPKPDVALRPTKLSVTRIETWRRDPYAIYAEYILKLAPLDEPDPDDGMAGFGTHLHAVLADFHKAFPHDEQHKGPLPKTAGAELLRLAEREFATLLKDADFRSFRWPRVQNFLSNFVVWDQERRGQASRIEVEQSGALDISLDDGSKFELTCRADRLELTESGVAIFDYKSGVAPSDKQVRSGLTPQLTLEGAMIMQGAFGVFPAGGAIASASYVAVGKAGPIKTKTVCEDEPLDALAERHLKGLQELASQFRKVDTPYLPRPIPQFASKYAVYDHLARVKEWGSSEGGSDE